MKKKMHTYGVRTRTNYTATAYAHSRSTLFTHANIALRTYRAIYFIIVHMQCTMNTHNTYAHTHTNDEREAQIDEAEKEGETERTTKKHAM